VLAEPKGVAGVGLGDKSNAVDAPPIHPFHAESPAGHVNVVAGVRDVPEELEDQPGDRKALIIGHEGWPFPVPIVKRASGWQFDTAAGKEEVLARRIGRNELAVIQVCRTYVAAQRIYVQHPHDGKPAGLYAQRFSSSPGKQDGLYWPDNASKDGERSPFGPLVAESASYLKGHKEGDPYRGYHFKILTRQGKSAPGGAYSYIINGRMIAGFAMVAYPAQYGDSGIMSFIINQNGRIYEKDLGKASVAAGNAMTSFDPAGWKELQE